MKIEHIAMYVNDLEATREFFIKYFNATSNAGYHNKTTDFRSYFLSFDDGVIFILHLVWEVRKLLMNLLKKLKAMVIML